MILKQINNNATIQPCTLECSLSTTPLRNDYCHRSRDYYFGAYDPSGYQSIECCYLSTIVVYVMMMYKSKFTTPKIQF